MHGHEEEFALIVATFVFKAAAIQSKMLSTIRRNDHVAASEDYVTLVTELTAAERDADVEFSKFPQDKFDPLDIYKRNLYSSCIIKSYHITHMMANYLTHHKPDHVSIAQLKQQREYCLQRVRSASEEILDFSSKELDPIVQKNDKSPRALFDTLKLIWPLTSVYVVPSTTPQQKAKAEMDLFWIGRQMGVRQALSTYPGVSAGRVPHEALSPLGFGQPENVEWVGRLR